MSEQASDAAEGEPEPLWLITERSVEAAQSRADMWLTFVGRALTRAREGGPRRWALETECWAFVVAVDHIRKCAVMAKAASTVDGVAELIEAALNAFNQAAPDVAPMRNVLEHHDGDYLLGRGRLQHNGKAPKKAQVNERLAADWSIRCGYADTPDCQLPWVQVGPADAGDVPSTHHLKVDLAPTYEAARRLRWALYEAARKQGLEATNQPKGAGATK